MIANFPKQPRDNEKRQRQVRFNEKGNRACENGKNNEEHKIYAYMARMSSNDERSSEKYGDSSQLTNWILDSGATCHFRCVSEDHTIAKCPKPPKDNEKRQRQVRFNEKGNRACENGENNDEHKIYTSMARMSSNDERSSEKYGDSSQLTNWI